VHNLPVVTDIASACPGADIDWVVEEPFAPIPALHPALGRALRVAVRRWRASAWKTETRRAVATFVTTLRKERYDAIIDAQGLFKSAVIARVARGTRFGFDWPSAREPLSVFYDRTFNVPRRLHAVERNRRLAAQALGYALPARADYGIAAPRARFDWLDGGDYCVLLHSTSARRKLWPEAQWIELGRALALRGVQCVLPWGNDAERTRSERIASRLERPVVPPRLALGDVASLLGAAKCALGVDTGLTHLACALGVPTVAIYVDTDPSMTGLYGGAHAVNVGGRASNPAPDRVLQALERVRA